MIVGERGAANEQWLFQCDDRRRRTIKTALYRRIEDKRRHHKDKEFLQSLIGHNLILVEKLPLKIGKLPILIGRKVAHR
ncbi:hypothetical protein T09_13300 [Trichinella sp. T9]|nr:hypothetical protein T09_13300 [Trichinella sp. T9]